ncbi:MAG: nitrogenase molybdenum-iron protein [Agathobacter sp.]|nr:nitrogenase molybdenum-iron protein [Agathobacter sp.]
MKGLFKYLTPFAPDQSGVVSVLYEFGGLLVICDAGGCAGNICGFDEPRWSTAKSAIFSAGLRDMDAIMGRDERLVKKLALAAEQISGNFAAVIGTPVPAVIATDYHALAGMIKRKVKLPVIAISTTGMSYYDKGAEAAYLELVRQFCAKKQKTKNDRIGVFGANPLDMGDLMAAEKLQRYYDTISAGCNLVCYGMGAGLTELAEASDVQKNLVVAPSGLRAARYLEEMYNIPYEIANPLAIDCLWDIDYTGKRVLIIHQQVSAYTLRKELKRRNAAEIVAANFFMQIPELAEEQDIRLTEEEQCEALLNGNKFDIVIADAVFKKMAKNFSGIFMEYPQFAVSGKLVEA